MTRYQCKCGWTGTEEELHSECTFNETRLEPAEVECSCPDCGASWDDMDEIDEVEWQCPTCHLVYDSEPEGGCSYPDCGKHV